MPGAPRTPAVAPGNLLPAGVLFDERPHKKSEKSTRFLTRTSPRKPEIAFPSSEPATSPPSPGNEVRINEVKDVRSALFAPPKEVTENERRLALSVSEQLEDHQVTIKVLLQSSQAELLARFDAMFAEQRERAEAASLKLQRQEERLEEGMDRLLQQKSSTGALSGAAGPGLGGCREQSSQQIEELTCKLQDKSEERLNKFQSTQEQSINQIKQLLMSHPLFRIVEERCKKYGNGDVMQHSSTPVGYRSTMLRNSTAPRSSQMPQSPPSEPKLLDSHAITEEGDGTSSELSPLNHHIRDARDKLRRIKKQVRGITPKMALDSASSVMIVANCIWMGFDIHLYSPDKESHHVRFVDVFFTVCFILELAARFLMQGTDFFMHPHLRMNAMDSIIIACQVADLFVTLFTISWLRSIRVVRLLKALKMLRSFENVKHLRLLVAAVAGSLQSLFWISTFLSFVLYVFSLVLMQLVQSQINDETMLTDEILLHYGTVRHCMTTLFKSISGGAPWATLVQPLSEISDFNTFIFMCIWTFLVIGCMNMFTAIFVEGMRVIVQRDGSMHAIEFIRTHKKDAPVNKMRKSLSSMTKDGKDGPGTISPDMLEKFRQNDEYMQTIEALGLEPWEVVGVFQTLDMASPGQVEVEDFIQALVKMKTQNEAVDLTTLLNENKRIQKRLTAFMRYTDDHFSEILTCLGTYDAPGSRPRSLSCYLPEWRDDD